MKIVQPRGLINYQETMTGDRNDKSGEFKVMKKRGDRADWKNMKTGYELNKVLTSRRYYYNNRTKDV